MKEKIRPLSDRVLVRRLPIEEKTDGGIFIPADKNEKAQTGTVIAVGPGRVDNDRVIPVQVKPGDVVFFGKYAGTEAAEDHIIMREDEILGVVDPS